MAGAASKRVSLPKLIERAAVRHGWRQPKSVEEALSLLEDDPLRWIVKAARKSRLVAPIVPGEAVPEGILIPQGHIHKLSINGDGNPHLGYASGAILLRDPSRLYFPGKILAQELYHRILEERIDD